MHISELLTESTVSREELQRLRKEISKGKEALGEKAWEELVRKYGLLSHDYFKKHGEGAELEETLLGSKPRRNPKYLGPTEKIHINKKTGREEPLSKKGFGA